jgi:hypothetical protein
MKKEQKTINDLVKLFDELLSKYSGIKRNYINTFIRDCTYKEEEIESSFKEEIEGLKKEKEIIVSRMKTKQPLHIVSPHQ